MNGEGVGTEEGGQGRFLNANLRRKIYINTLFSCKFLKKSSDINDIRVHFCLYMRFVVYAVYNAGSRSVARLCVCV